MLSPLVQQYAHRIRRTVRQILVKSLAISVVFALIFTGILIGIVSVSRSFQAPPDHDPVQVTIPSGMGTRDIAETLKEEGIIRSAQMFLFLVSLESRTVQAGTYDFPAPAPLRTVVERLHSGDQGDIYTRIRIREGGMVRDMAHDIAEVLPHINPEEFKKQALSYEGFLFPDTYFVLPEMDIEELITIMRRQFDQRIAPYQEDIEESGRTLEDIVIMASIIEKEATNDFEEQQIISGILWKRLDEGMLLQVDAPFMYSIGKGSAQLTRSDLASDSPFNTYRFLGLPPTPIGSPSLSALRAAIKPLDSPYYFYLHGNDGIVRYGRNFDEHIINRQRYLRLR